MATYEGAISVSMIADADLSSYQYYLVEGASTANTCQLVSGSAQNAYLLGPMQNDAGSGEAAEVALAGLAKVAASATSAITGGRTHLCGYVSGGANAGLAYPGTAGTTPSFGMALESLSSGSGIIKVWLYGINDPS
jgi:hypothetical protein